MLGHPYEVVHELVLCSHGEKRGATGGLAGQVLCPWSNPTKQRVLVQGKGKSAHPPSAGPAPGGSEVQIAYTLASIFLISVFTDLTYTHTHAIFNLQK